MSKAVIAFILGGVTGVVASKFYFKKMYDDILEEEIASVKKKYCIKKEKASENSELREENDKKTEKLKPVPTVKEADGTAEESKQKRFRNLNQYREILRQRGYSNYTNPGEPDDDDVDLDEPYTISPEDFGEKYGTENNITLTFYKDGVLEDESGELVTDIEEKIGRENLETFGEYEDDTVYVRNDILKMDYEIQRVEESYYSSDEDD